MIAVQHNNKSIARSLIRNDARSNFATCNGDSLNIARQNGFHDLLQILLEGTRVRARVSHSLPKSRVGQDAISSQTLRSTNWKETIILDEQWLSNDQPITKEQQDSSVARLNKIRLRNLRVEFRKQHTNILACADASVKAPKAIRSALRNPPESYALLGYEMSALKGIYIEEFHNLVLSRAWGLGFDADYSKAWNSGTNVIRSLLAGNLPSPLNDTIMFLAIAKAMCLSGSAPALSTWHWRSFHWAIRSITMA